MSKTGGLNQVQGSRGWSYIQMKALVAMIICLSTSQSFAQGRPRPQTLVVGTTQETDTLHPSLTAMAASSFIRNMSIRPIMWGTEKLENACLFCDELPSLQNSRVKIVKGSKKSGKDGDQMLVTWKLKPGLVWGDGTPITAQDFKLAWEVGRSPQISVPNANAAQAIEEVLINSKDPLEFTIRYSTVRYDFESIELIGLLPNHIERPIFEKYQGQLGAYEKKTAYNTDPTNPGLYNGPYRVKEFKPGAHVLLEKNPKFSGSAAQFEQIMYKLIPSAQTLEAEMLVGSVHVSAHTGFTMDQALQFEKKLQRDPRLKQRFRVSYGRLPSYEKIDFNLNDPILADVRVRRALAISLDRKELSQALFAGREEVADQIFNPLSPYYSKSLPPIAFNPAEAQKLLEEAGWKLGPKGIRQKDGKQLSLLMMTTSQNKLRELLQTYAQQSWRKIGVEVQFKNEPARVFFGETMRKRSFGSMALYGWTEDIPNQIPLQLYHSRYIPRAENQFQGFNRTGVDSKELDAVLEKATMTVDKEARAQVMFEFSKIFRELMVELTLFHRSLPFVAAQELSTPTTDGINFPMGMRVETWQWN